MKTCNSCSYFKLVNKLTLSGKCRADPKEETVLASRSSCRFYKDKNNFLEDYDEEIILEEKER